MNYFDLLTLAMPETIVSIAALAVLFVDLGLMRSTEGKWRRLVAAAITGMGCLLPIFWMFQVQQHTTADAWHGMLVVDPLTQLLKQAVLVLTIFTAWLSIDSTFTEHVGEYFALLMLATVGMMFMVGSENVLVIFVSLELISLSLYILAAFHKRSARSAEAALKYFLFGGMAAAFTLFGLSLLYGLSGSIELRPIAAALRGKGLDSLLAVAMVMTVIAAFSMVLGNLAALAQGNVKRLLAYSAIAHAGYAMLGVLTDNRQGVASLVYYVVTYALTVLGAFGVVSAVEETAGEARLADFAGLCRRAPLLSLCMMVFMLSLAGIPPLAGFFGKFYVFAAAAGAEPKNLGLLWMVIFAIAMSAVSLYYYLQVLKEIYVAEAPADAPRIRATAPFMVAVVLIALGVVVLGCVPDLLVGKLSAAIQSAGF